MGQQCYIVLNRTVCGLSKKKMPYLHLIDESIGLLNTEIRLIEWRIKYPEQLQQRINKQPLSPLYLADKTTLINIMEMVSGLFLYKDIVYQNGKPAYVAVNGAIYDVTNVPQWKNGTHQGYTAGKDLTNEIAKAPHGNSVLKDLPVVGKLVK